MLTCRKEIVYDLNGKAYEKCDFTCNSLDEKPDFPELANGSTLLEEGVELVEGVKKQTGTWRLLQFNGETRTWDLMSEWSVDVPEPNEPEENNPEDNNPEDNNPEGSEPEENNPEDNNPEENNPEGSEPEDGEPEDNEPEGEE